MAGVVRRELGVEVLLQDGRQQVQTVLAQGYSRAVEQQGRTEQQTKSECKSTAFAAKNSRVATTKERDRPVMSGTEGATSPQISLSALLMG